MLINNNYLIRKVYDVNTFVMKSNDYINVSIISKAYGKNIMLWISIQKFNHYLDILKYKIDKNPIIRVNEQSKELEIYNGLYIHPILLQPFFSWISYDFDFVIGEAINKYPKLLEIFNEIKREYNYKTVPSFVDDQIVLINNFVNEQSQNQNNENVINNLNNIELDQIHQNIIKAQQNIGNLSNEICGDIESEKTKILIDYYKRNDIGPNTRVAIINKFLEPSKQRNIKINY